MSAGGDRNNLFTGLLVGGLVAAYAALSHYVSVLPEGNLWAVLVAVAPALLMGLDVARRALGRIGLALAAALVLAAVTLCWPYLKHSVSWVFFIQHVAIYTSLGLLFARTLIGERQPLCTFFATFIHTEMSPAVIRYTRQVTVAWSAFFFSVAATSLLLFFLAPVEVWSVFANLLNLPLVGLMFVLEHLVRRRVLPPEDQIGPTAAFRAYQAAQKARKAPIAPSSSGR